MLLVPDFIKAIAAKRKARKLAERLNGQIDKEGGPSAKVYVNGQHRGRTVKFFFSVSWGHVSVTVSMEPKHDLYFHLRSKAGVKSLGSSRHRDYEQLEFAPNAFVKWSRDEDRLDARSIIAGLESDLRARMLALVKGDTAWNYTADGLEYDHVCSVFGGRERLLGALDLACDVAEGMEALAVQGELLNAPS